MSWLDDLWGDLLSEEPLRIAAAWATLDSVEQESVQAHLTRMATESGWADVQRDAAQRALDVILSDDNPGAEAGGVDPSPADYRSDDL